MQVSNPTVYDLRPILHLTSQKLTALLQYKNSRIVLGFTTFGYILTINLDKIDASTCSAVKFHKGMRNLIEATFLLPVFWRTLNYSQLVLVLLLKTTITL